MHDLHNITTIASLDFVGLHTLAMVVVDYLGRRLVSPWLWIGAAGHARVAQARTSSRARVEIRPTRS